MNSDQRYTRIKGLILLGMILIHLLLIALTRCGTPPVDDLPEETMTTQIASSIVRPSEQINAGDAVTLRGVGPLDQTVSVYADDDLLGDAIVDEDGNWSLDTNFDAPRTYDLTLKALNSDGVAEDILENGVPLVVDPAPTEVVAPAFIDHTVTAGVPPSIQLNGTGSPNSRVFVRQNGEPLGATDVGDAGDWSLTSTDFSAVGTYELTVNRLTSEDSVDSSLEGAYTLVLDADNFAITPATTEWVGGETLDAEGDLSLSGTGTPGSTIRVDIDGVEVATAPVGQDGTWQWSSAVSALALDAGDHEVTLNALGLNDNVELGTPISFTIAEPPAPTEIPATATPEPVEVDPPTIEATIDYDAGTLVMSGSALADSTVDIVLDGEVVDSVSADSSGNWTWEETTLPADGRHVAAVRMQSGDIDLASEVVTFAINTIVVPTLVISDSSDLETLILEGTGEPDSELEILINGLAVSTTTVDVEGNWAWSGDSPDIGTSVFLAARSVDTEGNLLTGSEVLAAKIGEIAAPSLSVGINLDNAEVTAEGKGEAGSTVQIVLDGAPVGTSVVDEDGNWAWNAISPSPGRHEIIAQSLNAVGDLSNASDAVPFVHYITPTIAISDTGSVSATVAAGGEQMLLFVGTAAPGTGVDVEMDGVSLGVVSADSSGNWQQIAPFGTPGSHVVTTRAIDVVGRTALRGAEFAYTVYSPPEVSLIRGEEGYSAMGNGLPGAQIEIVVDDESLDTLTVGDDGTWIWTGNVTAGGEHTLLAQILDDTGNAAATSEPLTFINYATPAIVLPTEDGDYAGGEFTAIGTAPPDSTLEILLNNESVGTTDVDAGGNWSWTGELTQIGVYQMIAQTVDDEGNVLRASEIAPLSMTPTRLNATNLPAIATGAGGFESFLRTADAVGLIDTLNEEGPYTVFAPSDAAFGKLPDRSVDALLINPGALRQLLRHHIVAGEFTARELSDGTTLETLAETTLTITVVDGVIFVDGVEVVLGDISAENGTIHALDNVLLPPLGEGIAQPLIDDSGVETFQGPLLTIVGSAEPNTELLVELNGGFFGETIVQANGTWLVSGNVDPNNYEILAYTIQNGAAAAISNPVILEVTE